MNKLEKCKLENGLQLLFYQDKRFHNARMDVFINFGGEYNLVKVNNKDIKIKSGIAHFLEHILIEHSKHGNLVNLFSRQKVYTNGMTSNKYTHYYIDTVHDFEDVLVKELDMVNEAVFSKEDVEKVRPAILKEKMMKDDNIKFDIYKLAYNSLYSVYPFSNTLGGLEDIKGISYEELKEIYNIFYQPSNQLIVISGNFDIKKIKELIEKQYFKYEKEKIEYILPVLKEPREVNKKDSYIKKDVHMVNISINYKIYIGNLDGLEKNKLGAYINMVLSNNFSNLSKTYKEYIDKKIGFDEISFSTAINRDYLSFSINASPNDQDKFIKLILKNMNNLDLDEELFEIKKNRLIINFIKKDDDLYSIISSLFGNLKNGYYEIDKVEDLESLSFDEYKKVIRSLDFSNYSITRVLKEDE